MLHLNKYTHGYHRTNPIINQYKMWKAYDLEEVLSVAPSVTLAHNLEELVDLSVPSGGLTHNVCYDLPDGTRYLEVEVARVKMV